MYNDSDEDWLIDIINKLHDKETFDIDENISFLRKIQKDLNEIDEFDKY